MRSEVERLEEDNRRLRTLRAANTAETDAITAWGIDLETEIGLLKEDLSKKVESRKRTEGSDKQQRAMSFELSALRRDKTELTRQFTNAKNDLDKRVTECQTFKVATENDKIKITEMGSLCNEKASQIQGRDSHIRDLQECRRFLESEIEGRDSEILALKEGRQCFESEGAEWATA